MQTRDLEAGYDVCSELLGERAGAVGRLALCLRALLPTGDDGSSESRQRRRQHWGAGAGGSSEDRMMRSRRKEAQAALRCQLLTSVGRGQSGLSVAPPTAHFWWRNNMRRRLQACEMSQHHRTACMQRPPSTQCANCDAHGPLPCVEDSIFLARCHLQSPPCKPCTGTIASSLPVAAIRCTTDARRHSGQSGSQLVFLSPPPKQSCHLRCCHAC